MTKKSFDPLTFSKIFADATRQQIMKLCCCQWLHVNQIADAVGVSQPTVSHHLNLLKEAGLVKTRSEGKYTYYTLNQEKVAFCCGELKAIFAPQANEKSIT